MKIRTDIDSSTLSMLPQDMLIKVGANLNLIDLSALLRVNKNFSQLIDPNYNGHDELWYQKFANHFSNRLIKARNLPGNWLTKFFNEYNTGKEYKDLSKRDKVIISFIKENDFSRLEKIGVTFLELIEYPDNHKFFIDYIYNLVDQKFKNAVFKMALKFYSENLLIKKDSYGNSILHWAVDFNQTIEIINSLIILTEQLNDSNYADVTPISVAASNGNLEIVEFLFEKGALINFIAPWLKAPLYVAAEKGHLDIVKFLVKNGADVHYRTIKGRETSLWVATKNGHLNVAEFLYQHGADINHEAYDTKLTPIWIAAAKGDLDLVKFLYAKGADFRLTNTNRSTPLFMAAQSGHLEMIKFLHQKGADIKLANTYGSTPLFIAAQNGHVKAVEYLIEKKAIVDVVDFSQIDLKKSQYKNTIMRLTQSHTVKTCCEFFALNEENQNLPHIIINCSMIVALETAKQILVEKQNSKKAWAVRDLISAIYKNLNVSFKLHVENWKKTKNSQYLEETNIELISQHHNVALGLANKVGTKLTSLGLFNQFSSRIKKTDTLSFIEMLCEEADKHAIKAAPIPDIKRY